MTQRLRSMFRAVIALAALAVAACATNPVTGQRELSLMSESQEVALGREMDLQVRQQMGVYDDPALQRYVSDIGLRLAQASERPALPWTFAVVNSPVVNAFALPGGYVYVTRGLLAHLSSEAELAGVLGHEIGHVTARHAARSYTRSTSAQVGLALGAIFLPELRPYGDAAGSALGLLFLKHGRDDELQADRLGAQYAARSGWDPRGIEDMLRTLGRLDAASTDRRGTPNWLATHPEPLARVEEISPIVASLEQGTGDRRRARDDYLRRVDGLLYGDDPKEGVVRDGAFVHPGLRLKVEFPRGWRLQNTSERVLAQSPQGDALMFLDLVQGGGQRSLPEIAQASMRSAGLVVRDGQMTTIGGTDAFVGVFEGQLQGGGRLLVRAAFVTGERTIIRIAGLATSQSFGRVIGVFDEALSSFRPLSAREAEAIRPTRLAIYTVRGGDTWDSIAAGPSERHVDAGALAVMNGVSDRDPPRPGDRIKIVVGA